METNETGREVPVFLTICARRFDQSLLTIILYALKLF